MQNKNDKDGPRPRPRSFVGGDSFEFTYDRQRGGLRSSDDGLEKKKKRPVSLYESLSQDMYAARRDSLSSSRPDEDGSDRGHGTGFARLNSEEKAEEINKATKMSSRLPSGDSGDQGLGSRRLSDASDSKKAAKLLYAELSSPPLKSGTENEKFNAVSRLRSLFDHSNSAPTNVKSSVTIPAKRDKPRSTGSLDRDHQSKDKPNHLHLDFTSRRPKYEKLEADKKRKLFAPPPAVKLDELLKRDKPLSPRSPEENKNLRFRRSSSKENEPPVKGESNIEKQEKKEDNFTDSKKSFDVQDTIQPVKASKDVDDKEARPSKSHITSPRKRSGEFIEKDKFEEIHERRRSIPKKRSSSFEFESLEDNVEVFGKSSIDINAMLGLEPPNEDPVAEAKEEIKANDDDSEPSFVKEEELDKRHEENSKTVISSDSGTLSDKMKCMVDEVDKEVDSTKHVETHDQVITSDAKTENDLESHPFIAETNVNNDTFSEDEIFVNIKLSKETDSSIENVPECEDYYVQEDQSNKNFKDKERDVEGPDLNHAETPFSEEIQPVSSIVVESLNDDFLILDDTLESNLNFRGNVDVDTEEKIIVAEDDISPELYEKTESGFDVEGLDAALNEDSQASSFNYDSFDSFALNMRSAETDVNVDSNQEIIIDRMQTSDDETECHEDIKRDESFTLDNLDQAGGEDDSSSQESSDETQVNNLEDRIDDGQEQLQTICLKTKDSEGFVVEKNRKNILPEQVDDEKEKEKFSEEEETLQPTVGEVVLDEEGKDAFNEEDVASLHSEEENDVLDKKEDTPFEVRKDNLDKAEENGESSDYNEDNLVIVSQTHGLDKKSDLQESGDENSNVEDGLMYETVELDDEEYDSDHTESISSGDTPHEYSFEQNLHEKFEDTEDQVDAKPIEEAHSEGYEDESYEMQMDASQDVVQLLPAPSQSCLSTKKLNEKKPRKVSFQTDIQDVIFTYSPEEYNRSNAEIDAVTASAEWELEKRVDDKDIFSVDLDKSTGGLGLSIIGLGVGTESGIEKLGIFVKSLTKNGAADRDRRIQVQDQILEVNGISLVGVTQEFAAATLKNTSGNVRFLMGRDKTKKHYQAPTSTADTKLQELERDHNLELNDLQTKLHKAEERAIIAEHNLDEVRETLLESEDKVHLIESELYDAKEEINLMKQSPFFPDKKAKNEIKKSKPQENKKVATLERSLSELSSKLNSSEENNSIMQQEYEDKIKELTEKLEDVEGNYTEAKKENDQLVSMLQKNAEKLNEAEQDLTSVKRKQQEDLEKLHLFQENCKNLEIELERLRESDRQRGSLSEELKHAEEKKRDYEEEISKLKDQLNEVKEEVDLKNQYADIVSAERDSLKTLANNLEISLENMQEEGEKKEIENAVKKMGYEKRIQELEDTIRNLKNADSTDGPPARKLFPTIARPQVEREVEIKAEANRPVQPEQYFIPPRDYEEKLDENKINDDRVESEPVQDDVDGDANIEDSIPVAKPEKFTIELDEDKDNEIIVETKLNVEEHAPDFSFIEDNDIIDDKILDDGVGDEKEKNIEVVVNPIQKPPRRYSDLSVLNAVKDLPLQEKVIEDVSEEDIIVEPEKERSQSILDAFKKLENGNSDTERKTSIEVKYPRKFDVVIKSDRPEKADQKPFEPEDTFFKDLPESSVDSPSTSDNEILGDADNEMPPEDANADVKVNLIDKLHDAQTVDDNTSKNVDAVDGGVENNVEIRPVEHTGGTENGQNDNDPDRSSFLEAFSKNPSFGSWLNGDLTIIQQERKEEQAEEIASQVVEGKERAMTSSSSSSSSSDDDERKEKHKQLDPSTSIRLDESYLRRSEPNIDEHDKTDSPLLRLGSSIEEVEQMSEPAVTIRPISGNFDELVPATTVLPNAAQHDKRKLASAISRKSPRKPSSHNIREVAEERKDEEQKPEITVPIVSVAPISASMENLSEEPRTNANVVSIDYQAKKGEGEKDKRKSFFSFLPKGMFAGKKKNKHKQSMENLLVTEESKEAPAGAAADVPAASTANVSKDEREEDEGVVPFDDKRGAASEHHASHEAINVPITVDVRINGDSGIDGLQNVNGLSAEESHSETSSSFPSPAPGARNLGSNENLVEGTDSEDGRSNQSSKSGQSWINRPVNEWDVRQVGLWLIRMDMEAYSQTFQMRNIDGHELLNLNGARLKELGVMHGDHRALIKRKIKEFKSKVDKTSKKDKDIVKESRTRDKISKKMFRKGNYTVNG